MSQRSLCTTATSCFSRSLGVVLVVGVVHSDSGLVNCQLGRPVGTGGRTRGTRGVQMVGEDAYSYSGVNIKASQVKSSQVK